MMLQFRHYSGEKDIIQGDQFAKLLLQSTPLDEQDVKEYLQRLESRLKTEMVGKYTVVNLDTTRIIMCCILKPVAEDFDKKLKYFR